MALSVGNISLHYHSGSCKYDELDTSLLKSEARSWSTIRMPNQMPRSYGQRSREQSETLSMVCFPTFPNGSSHYQMNNACRFVQTPMTLLVPSWKKYIKLKKAPGDNSLAVVLVDGPTHTGSPQRQRERLAAVRKQKESLSAKCTDLELL